MPYSDPQFNNYPEYLGYAIYDPTGVWVMLKGGRMSPGPMTEAQEDEAFQALLDLLHSSSDWTVPDGSTKTAGTLQQVTVTPDSAP